MEHAQPIAPAHRNGNAKPSRLVLAAYPLGAIAIAIIVWGLVVRTFKIKPYIIPAPETVFFTFIDRFGLLSFHALPTLVETASGLILSIVVGVPLAVAMKLFQASRSHSRNKPRRSRPQRSQRNFERRATIQPPMPA